MKNNKIEILNKDEIKVNGVTYTRKHTTTPKFDKIILEKSYSGIVVIDNLYKYKSEKDNTKHRFKTCEGQGLELDRLLSSLEEGQRICIAPVEEDNDN